MTDPVRQLTIDESRLLVGLLSHDFPGVRELRVQASSLRATEGCRCGCGTIDLHVPAGVPMASAPELVPIEGVISGPDGEPVGGVLLFVENGYLARLEVYSYDEPLTLPPADQVSWSAIVEPPDEPPRRFGWLGRRG